MSFGVKRTAVGALGGTIQRMSFFIKHLGAKLVMIRLILSSLGNEPICRKEEMPLVMGSFR